jgi:hypothetical protein
MHKSLEKKSGKIREIENLNRSLTKSKLRKNYRKASSAALCILSLLALGMVTGNLNTSKSIVQANSVTGVGVGIYWNKACTNRTTALNWGNIAAGSKKTILVYLRNEYNSAVQLYLSTSDWNPSICANYMSLDWNYSGQSLNDNEIIALQITLTVDSTINGIADFSFTTTITSTGL